MLTRLLRLPWLTTASIAALALLASCATPTEISDGIHMAMVKNAGHEAVIEASRQAFAAEGITIEHEDEWRRPVGSYGSITNGVQMYGPVSWKSQLKWGEPYDLYVFAQYFDNQDEATLEVRADTEERARRVFEFIEKKAYELDPLGRR
ncbi:MAG: hypothetical protein ACYTG5_12890 [Planctomycetota bacterium]